MSVWQNLRLITWSHDLAAPKDSPKRDARSKTANTLLFKNRMSRFRKLQPHCDPSWEQQNCNSEDCNDVPPPLLFLAGRTHLHQILFECG